MSFNTRDAVTVTGTFPGEEWSGYIGEHSYFDSEDRKNYWVISDDQSRGYYVPEQLLAPATLQYGDPVLSPSHYDLPGGIQVIDLIRGESFLRGNLIKYVFRAPHKGDELQDMKKAAEYLKWEIQRLENEQCS